MSETAGGCCAACTCALLVLRALQLRDLAFQVQVIEFKGEEIRRCKKGQRNTEMAQLAKFIPNTLYRAAQ